MARLSKRISSNVTKTKQAQTPAPKQDKKSKSKNYWILAMLVINFILLVMSFPVATKEPLSFAGSVLLELILLNMYVLGKFTFKEKTANLLQKLQYGGIILLVILFAGGLIQRYM